MTRPESACSCATRDARPLDVVGAGIDQRVDDASALLDVAEDHAELVECLEADDPVAIAVGSRLGDSERFDRPDVLRADVHAEPARPQPRERPALSRIARTPTATSLSTSAASTTNGGCAAARPCRWRVIGTASSRMAGADAPTPGATRQGSRPATTRATCGLSCPTERAEISEQQLLNRHRPGVYSGATTLAGSLAAVPEGGQADVKLAKLLGGDLARRVHHQVLARWFIGKSTTSRIFGSPASSMTMRSTPGAEPPCGGAPYLKALIMPAKLVSTSACV